MASVKRNQKALARDQLSSVQAGRGVLPFPVLGASSATTKLAERVKMRSICFNTIVLAFKYTTTFAQ
jgi:hypothetical protein